MEPKRSKQIINKIILGNNKGIEQEQKADTLSTLWDWKGNHLIYTG